MRHHRSGGATARLAVAAAVLVVAIGRPAPDIPLAAADTPPVVEVVPATGVDAAATVRLTAGGATAADLRVAVGATVVWRNDDVDVHALSSPDGAIDVHPRCEPPRPEGCLAPGAVVAVTFPSAGTLQLTSRAEREGARDRFTTTVVVGDPPTDSSEPATTTIPAPAGQAGEPSATGGGGSPTTTAGVVPSTTAVADASSAATTQSDPGGPPVEPDPAASSTTTPPASTTGSGVEPTTTTTAGPCAPGGPPTTSSSEHDEGVATSVAPTTTQPPPTGGAADASTTAAAGAVGSTPSTTTPPCPAPPTTEPSDPCRPEPTAPGTTTTTDAPSASTTTVVPEGTTSTPSTGPAPSTTAPTVPSTSGPTPAAGVTTTTTTATCAPATTTSTTTVAPCRDDAATTTTTVAPTAASTTTTTASTTTTTAAGAPTSASTTTTTTGAPASSTSTTTTAAVEVRPCPAPSSTTTLPVDGSGGPAPVGGAAGPPTTAPGPAATSTTTAATVPSPHAPPSPSSWHPSPGAPSAPGGFPAELQARSASIDRTAPRTTSALVEAAALLEAAGFTRDEAVRAAFGRFPVGGLARYGHDWWFPRFGPGWRLHQGTDIFAQHGTPVRAPAAGVATTARGGLGGLSVRVTEADGSYWYLAHLSAFAPGLQEGTAVEAGDVVGYVGDTGNAAGTPPHLHLEVHPGGGGAIDPKPVLDAILDEAEALAAVAADRAGAHVGPPNPDEEPAAPPPAPTAEADTVARVDLRAGADEALWSPGGGPAWMSAAWVRPPWPGSTAPAPASSDDPVVVAASLAAASAVLGLGGPRPRAGRRGGDRRGEPGGVSAARASAGGHPARRG